MESRVTSTYMDSFYFWEYGLLQLYSFKKDFFLNSYDTIKDWPLQYFEVWESTRNELETNFWLSSFKEKVNSTIIRVEQISQKR